MDGLKSEARPVPVPATKEGTGRKQGGRAGPAGRGAGRQGQRRGRASAPTPPSGQNAPRGAPRTHHRWGGGESKEARATTRNTGTGGQGAARSAVDPDVPYT